MNVEEFEQFVEKRCKDLGVAFFASPERSVDLWGSESNGYFMDENSEGGPKLAYAKGQPVEKWFPVLVHEYNHMLQWLEGDPLWHTEDLADSDDYLWAWLQGDEELDPELAKAYAMCNLRLELDCERRSVVMIEDMGLPLDVPKYIKTANSYVLFYHPMLKHRRWYDIGKEPYNTPALVAAMPESLYELDYENVSDEIINLYETHMPYVVSDSGHNRSSND